MGALPVLNRLQTIRTLRVRVSTRTHRKIREMRRGGVCKTETADAYRRAIADNRCKQSANRRPLADGERGGTRVEQEKR